MKTDKNKLKLETKHISREKLVIGTSLVIVGIGVVVSFFVFGNIYYV